VLAGAVASGTVISGGSLNNFGLLTGAAGTALRFAGANGLLVLGSGGTISGGIAGLTTGDTLDFVGLSATGATISGTSLLVTSGGVTVSSLALIGTSTGLAFSAGADGSGGTDITVTSASLDGTTVFSGQTLTISAGQTVSGTIVSAG
ncbi:hypothetical protein OEZ78_27080, partial [Leclercia adecarboxylata]|nr:hypothetical protein [Leclercia adecarboxylata]